MKAKILLFSVLMMAGISLVAQPANWREESPANFVPLTLQTETQKVSEGSKALKITFTETGTPYYVCDTFKVTAGAAFSFSIDILDNDPGSEVNQRVKFVAADGTTTNLSSSVYTTDNAAYKTYTYTGTTPANAVKAYIILRIYDVAAAWTGSGNFLVDKAVYTEGTSTTNLIVNGGFEKWNIPAGSTLSNWRESLPTGSTKNSVIVPETQKVTEGSTAVKYTFTETGTPYFLADTINVTGGSAFSFSIDILDNDPGAEVNTRITFVKADGTTENATSTVYTTDNVAYKTYTYTGTTPATAVKALVIQRIYDVAAAWTGSGTIYFDKAIYTQGTSTTNLILNGGFENWIAPSGMDFLTYKFAALTPEVVGVINNSAKTVKAEVPYSTDVNALVATFTVSEGATAKVGTVAQVSGTTANNFTSPVIYNVSKGTLSQNWTVTVTKPSPSAGKDITSFNFNALTPAVIGVINSTAKTISLQVPSNTNVTSLVPTIAVSNNATVSPASGVAQNFTSPVTYAVTAQDGTKQNWVVTVTKAPAGQTTLFFEDFEKLKVLPTDWIIINNDKYTQAAGEERWQDSAWVVATSGRTELAGTKTVMASSYTSNMPLTGRADDWLILPAIQLGGNSTLSWQALSTTSSGNYPDDYKVYIAPFTSGVTPNIAYFEENANLLISIAPENWSATVGRPGAGLANRSINLKSKITPDAPNGWFDKKVWIAFVLATDLYTNPTTGVPNAAAGGSNLAIDNIKVVNDISTGIKDLGTLKTRIYPNPANDVVYIDFDSPSGLSAIISITDISGRNVMTDKYEVKSGFNRINMNVSGLKRGMYFVKTEVDNNINVTKLILNE